MLRRGALGERALAGALVGQSHRQGGEGWGPGADCQWPGEGQGVREGGVRGARVGFACTAGMAEVGSGFISPPRVAPPPRMAGWLPPACPGEPHPRHAGHQRESTATHETKIWPACVPETPLPGRKQRSVADWPHATLLWPRPRCHPAPSPEMP